MNLMSAPVYSTFERSLAAAAEITLLACPGAPGCTIGGGASPARGAAGVVAGFAAVVERHAAAAESIRKATRARRGRLFKVLFQGYTKHHASRRAIASPNRVGPRD